MKLIFLSSIPAVASSLLALSILTYMPDAESSPYLIQGVLVALGFWSLVAVVSLGSIVFRAPRLNTAVVVSVVGAAFFSELTVIMVSFV